jgi:hypothetical protein
VSETEHENLWWGDGRTHLGAVAVERWVLKIEHNSIITHASCRLPIDEGRNLTRTTTSAAAAAATAEAEAAAVTAAAVAAATYLLVH